MQVFPPAFRVAGADLPELNHRPRLGRCHPRCRRPGHPELRRLHRRRSRRTRPRCRPPRQCRWPAPARPVHRVPRRLARARLHRLRLRWRAPNPGAPAPEQDRPRPGTHYGLTKLEGELAVRDTTARYFIVRTAWLYGADGNNFLKTMLRLALANPAKPIRVVHDQRGCPPGRTASPNKFANCSPAANPESTTPPATATAPGLNSRVNSCASWRCRTDRTLHHRRLPHPRPPPADSILANQHLRDAGLHLMRPWQDDLAEYVRLHRTALLAEQRAKLAAL